jgi:hypothetical protein
MDIISYIPKSVEPFFQILGLVEVWTHRSMELSPWEIFSFTARSYKCINFLQKLWPAV